MMILRILFLLSALTVHLASSQQRVRGCYYTNWSNGRPYDGHFDLETHYEDKLCTHIFYSFAKVEHDRIGGYIIKPYEGDWDLNTGYKKLLALKKKDRNLKTLLAVGGWTHASEGFKQMVETRESRAYFIKQSKAFLEKHGRSLDNYFGKKFYAIYLF